MAITLATLALIHGLALAGVLLLAKHSVLLVDEDGRPLGRPSAWTERVVMPAEAPTPPAWLDR